LREHLHFGEEERPRFATIEGEKLDGVVLVEPWALGEPDRRVAAAAQGLDEAVLRIAGDRRARPVRQGFQSGGGRGRTGDDVPRSAIRDEAGEEGAHGRLHSPSTGWATPATPSLPAGLAPGTPPVPPVPGVPWAKLDSVAGSSCGRVPPFQTTPTESPPAP